MEHHDEGGDQSVRFDYHEVPAIQRRKIHIPEACFRKMRNALGCQIGTQESQKWISTQVASIVGKLDNGDDLPMWFLRLYPYTKDFPHEMEEWGLLHFPLAASINLKEFLSKRKKLLFFHELVRPMIGTKTFVRNFVISKFQINFDCCRRQNYFSLRSSASVRVICFTTQMILEPPISHQKQIFLSDVFFNNIFFFFVYQKLSKCRKKIQISKK